jgi:hypothetical protein
LGIYRLRGELRAVKQSENRGMNLLMDEVFRASIWANLQASRGGFERANGKTKPRGISE